MQYSVNQIYKQLYQRAYDAFEIFSNFFGEEYVDLQMLYSQSSVCNAIRLYLTTHDIEVDFSNFDVPCDVPEKVIGEIMETFSDKNCVIYVWWPTVTVTNENDRSVVIQDLYAKVLMQPNGLIPYEYRGFMLNRATYTKEQFQSDYMHSHIQHIPKGNFSEFMPPCLGRGPIAGTIQTLKTDFDTAEWMLFCQELSMYVTVESLSGVPWRRLESIGVLEMSCQYNCGINFQDANCADFTYYYPREELKPFFKYYLEHGHLVLAYRSSKFVCGMSGYEYIIDVSNAFIEYYNKYLKLTEYERNRLCNSKFLQQVYVKDGKFYTLNGINTDIDVSIYNGQFVLNFKGREIRIKIIDSLFSESTPVTVLNYCLAMYILRNILRTINYKYKNEHNNFNSNGRTQDSAATHQRTIYL